MTNVGSLASLVSRRTGLINQGFDLVTVLFPHASWMVSTISAGLPYTIPRDARIKLAQNEKNLELFKFIFNTFSKIY